MNASTKNGWCDSARGTGGLGELAHPVLISGVTKKGWRFAILFL